ncbi:MAG: ATP-binding cassette domain-containing protein [Pseudomonadota bacterium]|nr:ATP-binding cassette domain-containing protein [Pseudomonadota bacterium]
MSFLVGENMVCGYGGADILHGCTVGVDPGEIAVVVGPNGAGKSTAMKAMFGMLDLKEGQVLLEGEDITGLKPQERVLRGMGFVPQNHNVFTGMTVEENLEMGAFIRRDDIAATMEQVYGLFPILKEKRKQPAGELSGGQRQQVAVGRALMTQPKILMLDEPTAGVSPIVMDELFDRIIEVAQTGIAILMVEQNAKQALNIADRGFVLVQGMARSILILDCDVHQGDGTARILADRSDIFTCSVHCKANYPARKATSDLDVEVERHIDDAGYMAILAETLARLEVLVPEPDLVLYDAGVDVHADDRLGLLGLSYDGIRARDAAVLRHYRGRGIPVATVIGGGYGTDLDEVAFRHSLVFHAALDEHALAPASMDQAMTT